MNTIGAIFCLLFFITQAIIVPYGFFTNVFQEQIGNLFSNNTTGVAIVALGIIILLIGTTIGLLLGAAWRIMLSIALIGHVIVIASMYAIDNIPGADKITSTDLVALMSIAPAFLAVGFGFTHSKSKILPNSLYLLYRPTIKIVVLSLLIWFVALLLLLVYSLTLNWLELDELLPPNNAQDVHDASKSLLLSILSAGIIVPVAEEVFFRGFLLKRLLYKMSPIIAIVISSMIFAVFHVTPTTYIPIFILGAAIGISYVWLKSIWAAITIHIVHNTYTLLLTNFVADA